MRRLFVVVAVAILLAVVVSVQPSLANAATGSRPGGSHQKSTCTSQSAVAGYGTWAYSKYCAFVYGSKGFKMGYAWGIPDGSNGRICVEGLGYVKQSDGSEKRTWYSLACGSGSSLGGIPWGNVAAYPETRAMVEPGMAGAAYDWTD